MSKQTSKGFLPKSEKFQNNPKEDVISVCMYCKEDATVLLKKSAKVEFARFPCSTLYQDSWRLTVRRIVTELKIDVKEISIMRITRFWVPEEHFLFHIIYKVKCSLGEKEEIKHSIAEHSLKWFSLEEVQHMSLMGYLESPELMEYISQTLQHRSFYPLTTDPEAGKEGFDILHEVHQKNIIVDTETNHNTLQEQLLKIANFTPSNQIKLYKEFLNITFPNLLMNKTQFENFTAELGWKKELWPNLFSCADISSRGGLTFKEFIVFLAGTEPDTPHGTLTGEIRCHYIFRYYDRNRDNILEKNELRELVMAVIGSTSRTVVEVEKVIENYIQELELGPTRRLSINTFVRKVGELKFRGTSSILRSEISVWKYLASINSDEKALEVQSASSLGQSISSLQIRKKSPFTGSLWNKKPKHNSPRTHAEIEESNTKQTEQKQKELYEVATHTVKLTRGGQLEDLRPIDRVAHGKSISMEDHDYFTRFTSLQYYDETLPANRVLSALEFFTNKITIQSRSMEEYGLKPAFSWGRYVMQLFTEPFLQVCEQCAQILAKEPRMIQISSPIYILGDLHGNYQDLMAFEQVLWSTGLDLSPCSLLFLGDYVDRGSFGVEVVAYLFAQKIKNPDKLFLIRGNHEIRAIQKSFTFYSECQRQFGAAFFGIWNKINCVFDFMPLAAVVDTKIFCCHGGIPPPWLCPRIETIDSIPCPLANPEAESSLAWDLMWNDPVKTNEMTARTVRELEANEGFASNMARRTGRVFSVEALDEFLKANGLSHVIRAHEVKVVGFQVQQKGKLLTVFSSSGYCGGPNEAACIFISKHKIRILRINKN